MSPLLLRDLSSVACVYTIIDMQQLGGEVVTSRCHSSNIFVETLSILFKLIYFEELANFLAPVVQKVDSAIQLLNNWGLGLNPKGPYQSIEKGKRGNFCVVFTYSIKRAHEIRNRGTTAKNSKCAKKRDVRAKFFFFFFLL